MTHDDARKYAELYAAAMENHNKRKAKLEDMLTTKNENLTHWVFDKSIQETKSQHANKINQLSYERDYYLRLAESYFIEHKKIMKEIK